MFICVSFGSLDARNLIERGRFGVRPKISTLYYDPRLLFFIAASITTLLVSNSNQVKSSGFGLRTELLLISIA